MARRLLWPSGMNSLKAARKVARNVAPMLSGAASTVLELLAPACCPVCGRGSGGPAACRTCRLPSRRLVVRQLRCDAHGPYLVLSGGLFRGPLRRMIHAYKYREDPFAEHLLLRQLAHAAGSNLGWGALVPVPTHPVRIRERGFAAVERLATGLGGRLGLPVDPLLVRARYTRPLTGRQARERRSILAGALTARPAHGALLVIDDVATTGTTLHWARRRLLEAGAEAVDLLTLAWTPPPEPGVGRPTCRQAGS